MWSTHQPFFEKRKVLMDEVGLLTKKLKDIKKQIDVLIEKSCDEYSLYQETGNVIDAQIAELRARFDLISDQQSLLFKEEQALAQLQNHLRKL